MSDEQSFLDAPKSPAIMNNQNDVDTTVEEYFPELMDLDLSGVLPTGEILAACQQQQFDSSGRPIDMPIISAENPFEELPVDQQIYDSNHEMPRLNNQSEMMEVEINMDKLQVNSPPYDITLTQLNSGVPPKYDYDDDEKTFTDLSNAHRNPGMGGVDTGSYGAPEYSEYELDQKLGMFAYHEAQPPVQVYRMETAVTIQQDNSQMVYETKPLAVFTPSSCSQSNSINDYFPNDNNTNLPSPSEDCHLVSPKSTVTPRSRKSSCASKSGGKGIDGKRIIGKVAYEKTSFRHRMTKAEKNKMSVDQLKERHLTQNKTNAKKCVEKKNNQKKELAEQEKVLSANLEEIQSKNQIQENGLLKAYDIDVFPQFQNNAPFGMLSEFVEEIEKCKREIKVDNNGQRITDVEELKEIFDEKEKKFQFYQKPNADPNLSQNTYASQKSRAKTEYELAKLQYSTANLELECDKSMKFGRFLESLTQTVNAHLSSVGARELPAKIVYVNVEQFEPS